MQGSWRTILIGMWRVSFKRLGRTGVAALVVHAGTLAVLALQTVPGATSNTPSAPVSSPTLQAETLAARQVERTLLGAAKKRPDSSVAQRQLGEFYLHQDRLKEGILYLERAQRLDPKSYDTGYDLSLAYLKSGDALKAAAELRSRIKQRESAELHNLLGDAEAKLGDYHAAAVDYYHAAELEPNEENIFDLASFLLQHPHFEGFLDRSLAFFRYGVQQYPKSAKLTVGLGVALYAEGNYDDAVQTLCAAVDLDPADPKPFLFLGKVSKASPPLIPEVRKRLERFVSLYPDNGPAIYYYAMSLWQRSEGESPDFGRIEALLQKAISIDPASYEAHFQLGVLYQDEQRYPEAIRELTRTISLRPDFSQAHYRLSLLYSRTHQKQLADEQLAILMQLKQEDAEAESAEDESGNTDVKQKLNQPH
jgi:tetratricopeptide (TPR) repeat protein